MKYDQQRIDTALTSITEWYRDHHRELPWRQDPTPYQVWISEIMLQQTRIEAVIPYYNRFLHALPDIAALAAVEEDKLLKLWEGLGYYNRARNLKKAAIKIMAEHDSTLPEQASLLIKLPGIGDYTAGAIASIAYGQPEPAVDGNVMRVITRLLADKSDVADPKTKKQISSALRELYPSGKNASLLTEGLMELGEVLCLPNAQPFCNSCPLHEICLAHCSCEELSYPIKTAGKERRVEEITVFLLCHNGRYAIRKRAANGLLAGLWEFPSHNGQLSPLQAMEQAGQFGCYPSDLSELGKAKHIFTHVEWHMTGYRISCGKAAAGFLWASADEIRARYPIPAAFRTYQKMLE